LDILGATCLGTTGFHREFLDEISLCLQLFLRLFFTSSSNSTGLLVAFRIDCGIFELCHFERVLGLEIE